MRALVIVPTYNERAGVSEIMERLFAAVDGDVDLMVVDDGSPDGTAKVVRERARSNDRITLVHRPGKLGLASAYLDGFERALEAGYDAVVEMDADLSHDPGDVPRLLGALANADVVIGSRYIPGGRIENWSRARRILSRGGNAYARTWLGWGIRDSTSGFRAYSAAALRAVDLSTVSCEGYAFQIEMTYRALRSGLRVVEIPITFVERREGKSKLSRRIVFEALWNVPRWGVLYRLGRLKRP